jgi:hypothetical protein
MTANASVIPIARSDAVHSVNACIALPTAAAVPNAENILATRTKAFRDCTLTCHSRQYLHCLKLPHLLYYTILLWCH